MSKSYYNGIAAWMIVGGVILFWEGLTENWIVVADHWKLLGGPCLIVGGFLIRLFVISKNT
jgi:hypothetical protein